MSKMEDNFIDLTVTSPPYDNLRTYNGYSFDFESIAKELFRVTKDGGVLVWVVGDATINGSESGTSFRQALFFKECGFNLHDTMIYLKANTGGARGSNKSYWQSFEYMFVLVKGKINTYNLIEDRENIKTKPLIAKGRRNKDGSITKGVMHTPNKLGRRFNVWRISSGSKKIKEHPAIFPEQLANDHIISWSNEGDLVYDPFMVSGTTAKMAIINKRKWIGSEMSSEYCDIVHERLKQF
tara:strand:- start:413 stop:1129 length:717 start_codon:yes stop_codon:yes gene_type:complete